MTFSALPTTGGFGAATPAAGGFGAPAATGFGAKAPGGFGAAAPAAGGFGAPAATGFGAKAPGGFGNTSLGGFGAGAMGGFGSGLGAAAAAAPAIPYPGIKGPGNASSWVKAVDFSQINDNTLFESLPVALQQHLIELRTFMNSERGALKTVSTYLNEANTTSSEDVSYSRLTRSIANLLGGDNAVDVVSVTCAAREREAEKFSKTLDSFEGSVRDYERRVWDPLVEQAGLNHLTRNSKVSQQLQQAHARRGGGSNRMSPFFTLLEDMRTRIEDIAQQIEELEVSLIPSGTIVGGTGNASADAEPIHPTLQQPSSQNSRAPAVATPKTASGGGSHKSSDSVPASSVSVAQNVVSQVNASFANQLASLTALSHWASRLHTRSNSARNIFTEQYGQTEADVLFTPSVVKAGLNALSSTALPPGQRRVGSSTLPSLPQLSHQQQFTHLQQARPPQAPAAGGFGAAPAAGTSIPTVPSTAPTAAAPAAVANEAASPSGPRRSRTTAPASTEAPPPAFALGPSAAAASGSRLRPRT